MYQAGQVAPLFSIALNRGTTHGPGGYLALGGTPPVTFSDNFVSTPIQITTDTNFPGLSFYAIIPEAVVIGNISAP